MNETPSLLSDAADRRQLLLATVVTGLALGAVGLWTQSRMGGQLLPHSFCISASEPLLLLHLASDALIAFAYLAIPWAMLNIVRKRADVPFGWVAWVFGAFIVSCGVTHAMEVWTLWYPVYWYAGVAKAFTAAVSLGTAWLLYRLTPVALAMPSAQDLRLANAALRAEIDARTKAERDLAAAHAQVRELLRKAEGDVRTTSAVLDRFFDEAPIGLALLGADGRVLRINAALSAGTGRTAQEYLENEPAKLDGADPNILAALDAVRQGAPRRTVQITRGSGEREKLLQCTLFGIPVEDDARLTGAVVLDVTAQEQLAAERARAIENLRDADARKNEFISVLAHELRNPLAPIATAASIVQRTADEKTARMADIIGRQVAHMARLLEDLLDVGRIVQGKMDVRLQRHDLGPIACQVAEDLRPTLDESGTTLHVEPAPEALLVQADEVRLAQAVGNYLHNAAKFAKGGEVRLTVLREGGDAVVRVEDTGPGLDPQVADRLFMPFSQGPQDLERKEGGLGLGLAITKGIVELHGGSVRAGSRAVGRGTAFELRLPLAPG